MSYKDWREGLQKDGKGNIIKNVEVPSSAASIKSFASGIGQEVNSTIKTIESEYDLRLDEIRVKALSDEEKNVPFQFQTDSRLGQGKMVLVINEAYGFDGSLEKFNKRIERHNLLGELASKNTRNLIEHEMAHVLTYQGVSPNRWELFDSELNEEFVRGVSGYADKTRLGAECIAEAFVKKRNGEEIPKAAKDLLTTFIERWRK